LLPPVGREELIREYCASDLLFLHLNDYDAFKKVLPSKIFEYAALGKPVWAGVAGYSAAFIAQEVTNAEVFNPCDVDGAIDALEKLSIQNTPRPEFIAKYRRSTISRQLASDIIAVGF
jgi:glycosyltransferase involved in cell wall biosynthesis